MNESRDQSEKGTVQIPDESPWRDEGVLRDLYWDAEMSIAEIADLLECGGTTVGKWMKRLDIPRRGTANRTKDDPLWQDEETLRELYWDKEMGVVEIADELGCAQTTISTWMNNHDIEMRSHREAYELNDPSPNDVTWETAKHGYESWYRQEGTVYVHRLLAVAEFGFNAVGGKEVHHINGIKWDNRPENIELLTKSEHSSLGKKVVGVDRIRVAEQYEHGDISIRDLGGLWGVSGSTVLHIHGQFYGGETGA